MPEEEVERVVKDPLLEVHERCRAYIAKWRSTGKWTIDKAVTAPIFDKAIEIVTAPCRIPIKQRTPWSKMSHQGLRELEKLSHLADGTFLDENGSEIRMLYRRVQLRLPDLNGIYDIDARVSSLRLFGDATDIARQEH